MNYDDDDGQNADAVAVVDVADDAEGDDDVAGNAEGAGDAAVAVVTDPE